MAFIDDVKTAMTLWIDRNATLKTVDGIATQKDAAADYAVATIQNMYGTIADTDVDPIAVQHAVLVAARFLRTEIPFKVDAVIERSLERLDTTLENERERRRQLNSKPKQKNVTDPTLGSIYPYGLT